MNGAKKQILLLFDSASIEQRQADPEYLAGLLEKHANQSAEYAWALYDDVAFYISNQEITVTVLPLKKDISEFDLVYFRRFSADQARAQAIAMYAMAKGVPIVDSEVATRKGSITKLTQYMKMALNDIPIPATFTVGQARLRDLVTGGSPLPVALPYIMKIADATRGNANELIRSHDMALRFIDEHPMGEVLVQEYIDNHGDYRVWVTGASVGPVFYRQRSMDGGSHKNNTSQGAAMQRVTDAMDIEAVGGIALAAANLFNRQIAGVDVVRGTDNRLRIFEVNRAPQVERTPLEDSKAKALAEYLQRVAADGMPESGSV